MKRYTKDGKFPEFMRQRETSDLGGYGVNRKLNSFQNEPWVFWDRNHNSWVVVEENSRFKDFTLPDGTPVALININGLGEIRWRASRHDVIYNESCTKAAADYFGLTAIPDEA